MSVETVCIVQAGQISNAVRELLASRLSQVTRAAFGEDASINWLEVPKGNGWTAGEASTTSIVAMSVPPMEQGNIRAGRSEELMARLVQEMREAVAAALNTPLAEVGMSTREIPSAWVMEGGDLMPEPGDEAEWLKKHEAKIAAR